MAGPIDTGARPDDRTDLDTFPVATSESGTDHSHLHQLPGPGGRLLVARLGAAPQPHASLVIPLTPGAIHLADARGFEGITFEARGSGRYALVIESYGLEARAYFRVSFVGVGAVRLPFSAFRSADPEARLDLSRLRALIIRLEGEPGSEANLELSNLLFYR
jgi:hypothetical protein